MVTIKRLNVHFPEDLVNKVDRWRRALAKKEGADLPRVRALERLVRAGLKAERDGTKK